MFLEFPGERRFEINNAEENECRASGIRTNLIARTRARARACVCALAIAQHSSHTARHFSRCVQSVQSVLVMRIFGYVAGSKATPDSIGARLDE